MDCFAQRHEILNTIETAASAAHLPELHRLADSLRERLSSDDQALLRQIEDQYCRIIGSVQVATAARLCNCGQTCGLHESLAATA